MAAKYKHPPVKYLKLGRMRADGLYDGDEIIIDPRLTGRRRMEVLIHEFLHHRFPDWSEEKVEKEADQMAVFLWKMDYRRVDNNVEAA